MSARIHGSALVVDEVDAARLSAQLRAALRLAWVARGLAPPHALTVFVDELDAMASRFRESPLVSALAETARAKPADVLPLSSPTETLSVAQAAAITGVSRQYVRQIARRGTVTAVRRGGRGTAWVLDSASVLAWATDRRQAHETGRAA